MFKINFKQYNNRDGTIIVKSSDTILKPTTK